MLEQIGDHGFFLFVGRGEGAGSPPNNQTEKIVPLRWRGSKSTRELAGRVCLA